MIPEQNSDESLEFAEEDAYDASLATLIDDLWTSGFLSLSGSLHLDVPVWAKPFAGISVVLTQMGLSSAFLETFADRFSSAQMELICLVGSLKFRFRKSKCMHLLCVKLSLMSVVERLANCLRGSVTWEIWPKSIVLLMM